MWTVQDSWVKSLRHPRTAADREGLQMGSSSARCFPGTWRCLGISLESPSNLLRVCFESLRPPAPAARTQLHGSHCSCLRSAPPQPPPLMEPRPFLSLCSRCCRVSRTWPRLASCYQYSRWWRGWVPPRPPSPLLNSKPPETPNQLTSLGVLSELVC